MHGESAILAHASISTLRPTTANQVLYDGPATEVNSGRDCRLRVVARWLPSQDVRWTVYFAEPGPKAWSAAAEVRFRLKTRGAYSGHEVAGQARDWASGWMDGGAVVGRTEAAAAAVLVRWVNLGDVGGGGWLEAVAADGTRQRWPGRQSWRLGEWIMAVDARPDLRAAIETLKTTSRVPSCWDGLPVRRSPKLAMMAGGWPGGSGRPACGSPRRSCRLVEPGRHTDSRSDTFARGDAP